MIELVSKKDQNTSKLLADKAPEKPAEKLPDKPHDTKPVDKPPAEKLQLLDKLPKVKKDVRCDLFHVFVYIL